MKKKIRIFIILFILSFSFVTKAEGIVELDMDCNSVEIGVSNSVTCEIKLIHELIDISDIEMDYSTNLNIDFKEISGFSLTKNGNKIKIHSSTPLYAPITDVNPIFKVVLSNKEDLKSSEDLIFKNIKINSIVNENLGLNKTFSVTKIEKVLDNTCTLENISVNNNEINSFNKDNLQYNIEVTNEVVNVNATKTSNKSSVTGLGSFIVRSGERTDREITVTAENNDTKVYILHITNTSKPIVKELSKDSTLKNIELYYNKEKIDFDFDTNSVTFDIKVDGEVDKLKIKAETNDSKATFAKKYGPRDVKLKYGDNKFELKVVAEDDSFKVYTLNINRPDERDTDNTLNSLKINGKEVQLSEKENTYEIVLASDVLKTEIEAIANSSKADVNFEDINLADGVNDVSITVTAENGEEKEYHIDVVREEEKKETVFEKIEITGYDIAFSKDKHSYTLKISNDVDELDIKVIPNDILLEVLNNKKLHHGSKVVIKVIDDEGEHEYTINIEKDSLVLNIICYGVFILGLVLLVLSIIRFIKIKKKKKKKLEIIE